MIKFVDGAAEKAEKKKPEAKLTIVPKVLKGETFLVMAQAAVELEDEWSSLYYTTSNQSNLFLQPPFEPNILMNFVVTNNVLNQCVEAMEVNIDGTGHSFVPMEDEDGEIDPTEEVAAKAFFDEPYPNLSFVKIRRKLRRQIESVGYGFLEVLRNVNGDIVGLRNIETHHVRFVKLDNPVQVTKKIMRNGQEVTLTYWDRERRYAQRVALKTLVYYKEFGCSRNVSRSTGNWEDPKDPIKPEDQATELLLVGLHPDIISPYYLPRWINQLPSVIGSRNAEEQNLQFLDSGGMPPAIVFIQGGTLTKTVSEQLQLYLSGQNKNKQRAVVVEAQSNSGSLEAAGKVDVKVERFGAEKAQDAMFMKYDAATEEHVRVGFRLPPLFLGKAADYNFATAQTAYMVAEAQVFAPERDEFDELINKTIIKALGFKTIKFKSNPITLKDVNAQLKGMAQIKDMATRESFLKETNIALGTSLKLAPIPVPDTVTATVDGTTTPPPGQKTFSQVPHEELPASTTVNHVKPQVISHQPQPNDQEQAMGKAKLKEQQLKNQGLENQLNKGKKKVKKYNPMEMVELAHDYAISKGLIQKRELPADKAMAVKQEVDNLTGEDAVAFHRLMAGYTFGSDDLNLAGIAQTALHHLQ